MLLAPYDPGSDHATEAHAQEFTRLSRAIESAKRFRLLFAQFNQQYYRDLYIERLHAYYESSTVLYVARENLSDAWHLRARVHELAQTHRIIHVVEGNIWQVENRARWLRDLNAQRELIAQDCPAVLLFWLNEALLKEVALQAPDLWSWRSGVFDFTVYATSENLTVITAASPTLSQTEQQRRQQRIAELINYLATNTVTETLRASLLLEQGDLHKSIGELNEAMVCFQTSLQLYRQLNDEANTAELLDRVAGILQARGELDEALQIRQQEILPICKQLGNERNTAVTMGKIADILESRGELEEALRIRQEEELPVYERLGDVRSKAVTMGQIADILYRRGELEEALRIRQQEELPVYERLGDVRGKAVTKGKIADILQSRGELEEALRIYQQEELPACERLGDVHGLLITQWKIAMLFMQFTPPRRAEANTLLCQALRAAEKMRIPEAGQIQEILQDFEMKC